MGATITPKTNGPIRIEGDFKIVDMTGKAEKTALNETWDVVVYRPVVIDGTKYHVFDVTSTQEAVDDVDPSSAQLIQNQLIPAQQRHIDLLDQLINSAGRA